MKIQQLREREPFEDIFERTLSKFLGDVYSREFAVVWNPRKQSRFHKAGVADKAAQQWCCNPALNSIFVKDPSSDVLEFISKSYMYTPSPRRRQPQQFYVQMATNPFTASILAFEAVTISPVIPNGDHILITGGNNRIRLLDFGRNRSWEILKAGFDKVWLQREVDARLVPGNWPIPALRAADPDGRWFETDLIHAFSLNRLPSTTRASSYLNSAFATLSLWLDRTVCSISPDAYVAELSKKLVSLAQSIPNLSAEDAQLVLDVVARCNSVLKTLPLQDMSVCMAKGHGDFQDGNILVDSGESVWLVDWEHSDVRQLLYDYLVYALRSRFPLGLTARIAEAVQNPHAMMAKLPGVHDLAWSLVQEPGRWRGVLLIFLLEDTLWNLQENANPCFTKMSGAWLWQRDELLSCIAAIDSPY